jgi:chorismate synthase
VSRIRLLTAGESHGKSIVGIIENFPRGVKVSYDFIMRELSLRRGGYGRSERMKKEKDEVEFLSGIRGGETTGAPISFIVRNSEWENWKEFLIPFGKVKEGKEITSPRPGHADFAGAMKFLTKDIRDVLERASARTTVARVVAGALAKLFLLNFGIECHFHVVSLGKIIASTKYPEKMTYEELIKTLSSTFFYCLDKEAEEKMKKEVDKAREEGYSLGGVFEVRVKNVPPGLGSFTEWDRRMDARIGMALMSIPSVKGVEIGNAIMGSRLKGSEFHDPIFFKNIRKKVSNPTSYSQVKRFYRKTNNAGGIEGGITNGEDIIVRGYMKPIPTMRTPLQSVDLNTKRPSFAHFERADVTVVPAGAVIGSACVAYEICNAFLEKFGGDTIEEIKNAYKNYLRAIEKF